MPWNQPEIVVLPHRLLNVPRACKLLGEFDQVAFAELGLR